MESRNLPLSWHETEEKLIIADRSKYVSPDGQPNDMTDFCTAVHWLQHDALERVAPSTMKRYVDTCSVHLALGPLILRTINYVLLSIVMLWDHLKALSGNSTRRLNTVPPDS